MRREELRVLLVVCLGTFFHIQSVGSISISLAAIQKEFGASLTAVQWIGLMGSIMLSSLSLCFGRIGDRVGRKTLFKTGLSLVLAAVAFYPVTIFGPLYLLNVIGISPLASGLAMATLPFCTTLLSPLSGRLADRVNPRWVALFGVSMIVLGVALYARLGAGSTLVSIVLVLSMLGAGIGLFVPANEKAAFAAVPSRDYRMLSAMLIAFGTGSGALGTTVAVALAELAKKSRMSAAAGGFAYDQQFAFSWLLPLAVLAALVTMVGKRQL